MLQQLGRQVGAVGDALAVQQRLDLGDPAGAQVDDRLVAQLELLVGQTAAKLSRKITGASPMPSTMTANGIQESGEIIRRK